ncbi:MAG: late competence development ComFB family protein [Leptolyngbyaceae cyanobacterium SM1_1_3]|nr:late competence development ComFB family protein [Leptolyngbyaceae cyanobacterium SM1_1_3]NJN03997.1 late competence development ComFB family protein [Leptolyngbyaceae cyanobacterium RM1_1_2]NJO11007.1 late competence development ComFB family protein [Leptolyngbyaceae cyanobacterium SL_1_1]
MAVVPTAPKREYINVMEILVAEEVAQQLKKLSPRVLKYVRRAEVETYALNRLPALYASSEKGWEHQVEKAQRELHAKIVHAVRQAFAAVQVDPIRLAQPLNLQVEENSQATLQAFRELLKQPDLSWDEVFKRIKQIIRAKTSGTPPPTPPSVPPTAPAERHAASWRPGTYGGEVVWRRRTPPPQPPQGRPNPYGWDDPNYRT